MCGIVGILGTGPVAGSIVDALKRLEYRGYDSAGVATLENGKLDAAARRGQAQEPGGEACRGAAWRGDRHRPHALGDARQADGNQRPSARLAEACGRPQRHHREFSRAAAGTRRQRLCVCDGDRFRDCGVRRRGRTRKRQAARGGGSCGARPAARGVRARLSVRGRGGSPDRRAPGRAAGDRLWRRGDVSGLGRARA